MTNTKDTGVQLLNSRLMIKVPYLNDRRGRLQADLGLQIVVEKGAEVMMIAEAVDDQSRRNKHET